MTQLKVTEYSADSERDILLAMLRSEIVAGRIASQWRPEGLFAAKAHNVVGEWMAEHWKKYRKVLGSGIAAKFREWASEQRSRETVEQIEEVLNVLSRESAARDGEPINADYVIDAASKRFTDVRIVRTAEEAIDLCRAKRTDRADAKMRSYAEGGCNLIGTPGVDLFLDREMVAKVFAKERNEPLVRYDGELGRFFANKLARDSLVAFCGPAGFGKSWWLADVAWRAMLDRRRVAYFDCGDMSDVQVGERFLIRAAARPRFSDDGKWPFAVKIPRHLTFTGKHPEVAFDEKVFKAELDEDKAWEACERVMRTRVKSGRSYFKLVNLPSKTATVPDLMAVLKGWELDGWVPDVCLAEGSLVLTDKGLIPIESVEDCHRLWDGERWVSHGGRVYKGVKDVIDYAGVTATPDHRFWTEGGWRTLESCSRLGLRIARTGDGRRNLRIGQDYVGDGSCQGIRNQETQQDVHEQEEICLCRVCAVRCREMGDALQYPQWYCEGVSFLYATQAVSSLAMESRNQQAAELSKSKQSSMEALWRQRDRIPVCFGSGGMPMDYGQPWSAGSVFGNRPRRQRRALRAGEHSHVHAQAELLAYPQEIHYSDGAQIRDALSRCCLCGRNVEPDVSEWDDPRKDNREMEGNSPKMRKSKVWDIANSGPFHRFTVQGLLAHNCVIDYADILAPINKRADELTQTDDTWVALRSMSQQLHCLVVTATQTNREAFGKGEVKMGWIGGHFRKLAHVNAMWGINSKDGWAENQITTLTDMKLRSAKKGPPLYVANCLALGNPAVLACRRVFERDDEPEEVEPFSRNGKAGRRESR